MTAPDPVTDVWELLWTAACDYHDRNPKHPSVSRLVDALMPIVRAYGDARVADKSASVRVLADHIQALDVSHVKAPGLITRLRAIAADFAADES